MANVPSPLSNSSKQWPANPLSGRADIAHAGGIIGQHRYSNSREAIQNSIISGFSYIELDVVACSDGFLVAHDGMEKSYGIESFSAITEEEFLGKCRVYGRFHPVGFDELRVFEQQAPSLKWIFDTKFKDLAMFRSFLRFMTNRGLLANSIFQVYSIDDARLAYELGVREVVFALWKKFGYDSLSTEALAEVEIAGGIGFDRFAVSLRHQKWKAPAGQNNLDDPRFPMLQRLSEAILLHEFSKEEEETLRSRGFPMFCG